MANLDKDSLNRAATRIASGLVRKARRVRERLLAPDAFEAQVAAARAIVAAAPLGQQVIIITGSSRGVGLALAEALGRGGAKIVINGRDRERLGKAGRQLDDAGIKAHAVLADVATPAGAAALVEAAVGRFGRIDALINNAGVSGPVKTRAWEVDPGDWAPVIDTNLSSVFHCAREAMRWMHGSGNAGRIVNVSSGAGRAAAPGMAPYVASKFGLEGLTRALAMDSDGTGIVVCAIELGTLRTDMSKVIVPFGEHERLPPPQTVVPVFVHALTGPAEQVSGRVYAAWRFEHDAAGEAALARSLAQFPKFVFAPVELDGRKVLRDLPGMRAFDRAENPIGMPKKVRELLAERHASLDFSRYPGEAYSQLREALASRLDLPKDDFTFGPGSAELVERIVRTFGGTGEDVVANDPTWFMFDRYCAMHEVALRKIPVRQLESDGTFDHNLDGIARAVHPRTRMIYLINPSNPLGNGIDHDEFLAFLDKVPKHIPVVVDEAYVEFSQNPRMLRLPEVVRASPPERLLMGLRTFSKFFGLAGLRIGYSFGTPAAMSLLGRLEHLFCISSLAEEAAIAALADATHAQETHALLRTEKARLRARLAEAGLACLPSEAHFMLVECPAAQGDSDRVWGAFVDAGILVPRGVMFDRYMMLPILKPEHNDRHVAILVAAAEALRSETTARIPR